MERGHKTQKSITFLLILTTRPTHKKTTCERGNLDRNDPHFVKTEKSTVKSSISSHCSAAAKSYFFKWVQPAVRHRLTYIKMFVLTSSLRKPMLTTWHFGAGGDILGQKHAF